MRFVTDFLPTIIGKKVDNLRREIGVLGTIGPKIQAARRRCLKKNDQTDHLIFLEFTKHIINIVTFSIVDNNKTLI